jgi:hypothetical protein
LQQRKRHIPLAALAVLHDSQVIGLLLSKFGVFHLDLGAPRVVIGAQPVID